MMIGSKEKSDATQATGGIQSQQNFAFDKIDDNVSEQQNQEQVLSSLEPNFAVACRFLTLLDAEAENFTFQTFDDNSKRKATHLARIFHGRLEDHFSELCKLQKKGAGVFVTIGETDGKGRKKENIKRVRAFFVDLDGSPLEPIFQSPIPPSFIIESSPGRFHTYWIVRECPLASFSDLQKELASRFSGDPVVCDLARVMRLPGFIHQKNEPFLTRFFEEASGIALLYSEFERTFNLSDHQKDSEVKDPTLAILIEKSMIKCKDTHPGCYSIVCPWTTHHTSEDRGTKYYQAGHNGYTTPGFRCFHGHCKDRKIHDLLEYLKCPGVAQEDDEWPEPKIIQAPLYPVPKFDPETLLPEVLRGWIMDEADRMPCPPDFVAAAAMVALGTIVGARCVIKPKSLDDWTVVPNLWGGIVGLPSAKKSPAIGAALKPLDRLILRAKEVYQKQAEEYEVEKTISEAQKEAIEYRIKQAAKKPKENDLTIMAQELLNQRQQTLDAPILRRYKSNDTTIEKLGELLRDNPAGLLMLRDELVGLISSWDREGREGERAFYLEAWNGNSSFDTDRIKRGTIFIPNLCVSIFGGIQPDKMIVYLEQASKALSNDGLLQRFQLLVYPDHQDWEWRDRMPNKKARDDAFSVFEALADFDPVAWGASPIDDYSKFPHFSFDSEAQKIFIAWMGDLHLTRIPNEDNPLISQHLAKYDKLFPALALLFHLVDCATKGESNKGCARSESAWRAAAWCEYLEAHARRCYGLLADDGLRSAQALANKLQQSLANKLQKEKLLNNFTARDVRRNQWRNLTTDGAVESALDWLEDEGWLRGYEVGGMGPGTGRPTRRYRINPKITGLKDRGSSDAELA